MTMENGEHIPDVVRAKRFELVDDDGKPRAALGFISPRNVSHDESEDTPRDERDTLLIEQITSFLQEQHHREGASGNEEMPFMALFDKEGSAKMVLWLEDGTSNIALMGKEDSAISLSLDKDGNSHLSFHREGAAQLLVDIDEDGPALRLLSKDKSDGISLRIIENGPALRFFRNDNLPEGQPIAISLTTARDRLALSLSGKDEIGLVVSLDKDNKPNIGGVNLSEHTYKSLI